MVAVFDEWLGCWDVSPLNVQRCLPGAMAVSAQGSGFGEYNDVLGFGWQGAAVGVTQDFLVLGHPQLHKVHDLCASWGWTTSFGWDLPEPDWKCSLTQPQKNTWDANMARDTRRMASLEQHDPPTEVPGTGYEKPRGGGRATTPASTDPCSLKPMLPPSAVGCQHTEPRCLKLAPALQFKAHIVTSKCCRLPTYRTKTPQVSPSPAV